MDSLIERYRNIVEQVLQDYVEFLGNDDVTQLAVVTDREHDRYLLIEMGWQDEQRLYGTLIHIDIIDGKLWVQQDGTESGVAEDLVAAGVLKQHIVLGFKSVKRRAITEFATA